ncbi:MAG: butyryl-CoA:acetate CoA-transferase [Firmicutes bacterium]|nr:butyryl-CoA:acetate CoA-transferase [Bacillota bacterium]
MDYREEYQRKLISADQAAALVKSGDWVDYSQFNLGAVACDQALARRQEELFGVKIRSVMRASGPARVVEADSTTDHFMYHSWHFSGLERKYFDRGLCWFSPILYGELPRYYREAVDRVDVAFVVVTPMNEHGYFNFSNICSASKAICDKAKTVVLEVNRGLPWVYGGSEESIHISEIDFVVEGDNPPLVQLPSVPPTEVDQKIAELIMPQISDGACIQLGVGGMPNTVGALLAKSDLKDLGVHTEMLVDAFIDMFEQGKITNAKKSIDRHKMVFTFGMGTQKLYDFMNHNPVCATYPVSYTNDPFVISQNDKVVAINNAVEVDLFGQVTAESSGLKHISGTGGQLEFTYGAYRSRGGKAFTCLSSTYNKKGEPVSRIKPILTHGSAVTVPRTMVQYVVTEYGIAPLKGKTTWERAESIINVAHPQFRDELVREAEKMGIWKKSSRQ